MVFRMDRKHAALLQLGIGIVVVILFIGVLNSVVYSYRTPLVTTESLWKHAANVTVRYLLSAPDGSTQLFSYSLAQVGTYHAGYIYVNVPYTGSFDAVRIINLYNIYAVDGQPLTLNKLVESGAGYLHIYVEPVNTSALSARAYQVSDLRFAVDSSGNGAVDMGDRVLVAVVPDRADGGASAATKLRALFPDGGRVNRTLQLDIGSIIVNGMGFGARLVGFARDMGDVTNLRGLKLKIEVYGVSEKPVLKALTEPIYSLFAALYATFLAVIRRVKQFAASAFGGFVSSFTLTGLIGDPVTALILTMVFVTVVFLVIKKK